MAQRQTNSWGEEGLVNDTGEGGEEDFNTTDVPRENNYHDGIESSNNDIYTTEDIREQYRIMAQMEANLRVKDKTGFDMAEYKQQVRRLKEQQKQEEDEIEKRYRTKPKPMLPQAKESSSGTNEGSNDPVTGPSRPQEPTLPFTRANRRYTRNGRNNKNRVRVPELCLGVVVSPNSIATTTAALPGDEHLVKCW
eukprot:CAMPEP_0201122660 /NCGR_PEP_ID=MMETSP0850-20130426/6239_1 /ASSEMBLY_ACC=CAM_ASM_000622 /TAXON_ID=183588 /ORGANISM="Pseudo-nitzschia fraudulenta, Strain WWA7" /LENGTH=193 /DNA_ID=CAMNT_0047389393 /DNA_START=61 /DNA_END=639 /DNA_ORIENTATION=-